MAEESGKMIPTKSGLSVPLSELESFLNALHNIIPQIKDYAEQRDQKDLQWYTDLESEEVRTLTPDDLKGDDAWGS